MSLYIVSLVYLIGRSVVRCVGRFHHRALPPSLANGKTAVGYLFSTVRAYLDTPGL